MSCCHTGPRGDPKVVHRSKASVKHALRKAREKNFGPMHPYWCRHCHGWHLGHTRGPL